MNIQAGFAGRLGVRRYDGNTGAYLGSLETRPNTAVNMGRWLELLTGASTAVLDLTNAELLIHNTADSVVRTITGCDAGFPDHSTSKQVVWEWTDDAGTAYDADDLYLRRASNATNMAQRLATGWSKPSGETWVFTWTVTITGDANFVDEGLDHWLRKVSGNRTGGAFNQNTRIQVQNNGNTISSTHAVDAAPSVSAPTATWEFTSAAGENSQEWYRVIMQVADAEIGGDGFADLTSKVHDLGTKAADLQRLYQVNVTAADDGV